MLACWHWSYRVGSRSPNQIPNKPTLLHGTIFTPEATGNLETDLSTSSQVLQGTLPQMRTRLSVSSLSVSHAPSEDAEEDTP